MGQNSKKQKVLYIMAAAGFVLLALVILFFLLRGSVSDGKKKEAEPTPTPAAESATAAPAADGITIGGGIVERDAESFYMSGKTLTAEDAAAIASLGNLRTLSLTNCGITDLSFLSSLSSLRTLYLPDNGISDLSPLSALGSLSTLYLDRNPLTDLSPLTALPNLTTLSIKGVSIADYVLEDMNAAMPNCRIFTDSVVEGARPISMGGLAFTADVEALDLSNRGVSDISGLSYCLKLQDLDLSGNHIDDFRTLNGLPRLVSLHLAGTGLTDEALDTLKMLQKLSYLDLRGNKQLTAEGLDALKAAMPGCQIDHDTVYYHVTLGGWELTSDMQSVDLSGSGLWELTGLEKFHELTSLRACENNISNISPLRELWTMRELNLRHNNIADISALSGHAELRTLDLSYNVIGDIYALGSCTNLEELDLSYNAITYLTHLNACTGLRRLNLTGNPGLTAEQILSLQGALPNCEIITDVDLSPTPTAPPDFPGLPEETPEEQSGAEG